MQYLPLIHMNPDVWATLAQAEVDEVMAGHDEFIAKITESGEMVSMLALAEPKESTVVRVPAGAQTVTDGPFVEAKEFLAGSYLVECASKDRAIQLAAMVPDVNGTPSRFDLSCTAGSDAS